MKISGEFIPVIPDGLVNTLLSKQLANGSFVRDYLTSSPGFDKQEVMDQIVRQVLQEVLLVPALGEVQLSIPVKSTALTAEDFGDQVFTLKADMNGRQFRTLLSQDLDDAVPTNYIVREAFKSMLAQMHLQVVRTVKSQKTRHPTNVKPTFVSPHARSLRGRHS